MVDYVGQHEYVRVADLVDRFAVSEVTIRGDLAAMHLWAGTGHKSARSGPAAQVTQDLWREAEAA